MIIEPGKNKEPRIAGPIQDHYDCLVIGAGPGGGTTAALVAQKGWKTLLVEREAVPRFHVGESLMPETYWTFERLGVLDDFKNIAFTKKYGVQFVSSDGKESTPFVFAKHDPRPCSETWHVERADFDCLLFDTAAKNGADCRDMTRVMDVQLSDTGVHHVTLQTSEGQRQTVTADVVVDASGQQAMIASRLGLKQIDPSLKKAAIWGYFENAKRNPVGEAEVTCILHTCDKEAWFWYIPLRDGSVSVGVVADNDYLLKSGKSPEEMFQWQRERCEGIKRRMEGSEIKGDLKVAKEFSYTTSQRAGRGWVLVGDAYGFIDPVYSSGVFLALKSGEMAADAIDEGLRKKDLSAEQLSGWVEEFDAGIVWIRKLVHAFYCNEFSFGSFMKSFPQHAGNLTDLLVGKVFDGQPGKIFGDMDPWMAKVKEMTEQSMKGMSESDSESCAKTM